MENEGRNRRDLYLNYVDYKIHNGYSYTVNKTMQNGTKYLCCKEKNTRFCKGTARVTADGVFEERHGHCHVEDEYAEEELMFRTELKRAVVTQGDRLKSIYDTTRLLYPTAATRLPYVTVEPSMRRWRAAVSPPTPRSLAEWAEILQDETWRNRLSYNGGALSAFLVRTGTGENASVSVVFGNRDFIRQLQPEGHLFIDATFKIVPRDIGGYQLLTIMIIQHNHAIPFAWALMDRKTQSAYRGVLDIIKTELAPHLRPLSIMCDFEKALRNEVAAAFPDSQLLGCYFHYCQALLKKARKLGVRRAIAHNVDGRALLQNYMALALLPAANIEENARSIYAAASPDVQRIFQTFKVYYERQWLRRETPESFSVYGEVRRTNNCAESFNNRLLSILGPRPTIWNFTAKMTELQANVQSDLDTLRTGRAVTRTPKLRYLINDARIRRAWREFEEGSINAVEFLERARSEVDLVDRNMELAMAQDEAAGINLDVSDEENEEGTGEQDVIANHDDRPVANDHANDLHDFSDEHREFARHWDFLRGDTNNAERTLDDSGTPANNIIPSPNGSVSHDRAESRDGAENLYAAENLDAAENHYIIENLDGPTNGYMDVEPIVLVRSPLAMPEDSDDEVVAIDETGGAEAGESAATTPAPTAAAVGEARVKSTHSKKRNQRRKRRKAIRRMQAMQMGGLYGLLTAGPNSLSIAGPSGLPIAGPSRLPTAGPGALPIAGPSRLPTAGPSSLPIAGPSGLPVAGPSALPIAGSSRLPIAGPSRLPAAGPSRVPMAGPSWLPTAGPSGLTIAGPSRLPIARPSSLPSGQTPRPFGHKRRKHLEQVATTEEGTTGDVQTPEVQTTEAPTCLICCDKPAAYRFLPCEHDGFCDVCALRLFSEEDHWCPFCRQTIEEYTLALPLG